MELGEGNGQVHVDFQYVSFSEDPIGLEHGADLELEVSTPMPSLKNLKLASSLGSLGGEDHLRLESNGRASGLPHHLMPSGDHGYSSSDSIDSLVHANGSGDHKFANGSAPAAAGKGQGSAPASSQGKENRKGKNRHKKRRRENGAKANGRRDPKGLAGGLPRPLVQRNAQIGVLYVSLQEARGLVNSDWSGLCSAFVRIRAGPSSRYESKVASKSLVPTWKENFELVISDTRECKVGVHNPLTLLPRPPPPPLPLSLSLSLSLFLGAASSDNENDGDGGDDDDECAGTDLNLSSLLLLLPWLSLSVSLSHLLPFFR